MKKYCLDLTVKSVEAINGKYVLMKLTDDAPLPDMLPGQFVEIKVDRSPQTFLRRPISINNVDRDLNELHLLIACVGEGTRTLAEMKDGDKVNVLFPLGNGFTLPAAADSSHLLVGGGVGVAPLLYLGRKIREMGSQPTFLLGARSAADLLMPDAFRSIGRVFVTTEDGSAGIRITDEPFSKALCAALKKAVVSTSANISGEPTPAFFSQISPAILEKADYVVKFRRNDKTPASPSSVIKLEVDSRFKIIRP